MAARSSSILLPLSILIGCSIVAAAVVLTRPPAPPTSPAAPPAGSGPPQAPPAASGPPQRSAATPTPVAAKSPFELPASPPAVRERGQENAARGLAALRPTLLAACWTPLPDAERSVGVRLTYNLSFSPEGRIVAWGISQQRGGVDHPRLMTCLRDQVLDALTIPAPGVPLAVEVPFVIP